MDLRYRPLALLASAAIAGVGVYALTRARRERSAALAAGAASTTSSAQGVGVYETEKAVAEYLMFHFGAPADIMPYPSSIAPHGALDFAARTGRMCARAAAAAGLPLDAALDVGCAVGGTSFDLTRDFSRVVGIDFSHAFVAAANSLKAGGSADYTCAVEGELSARKSARVPAGVRAERVAFRQGDACALASAEELGGRFTVIHGANLLCRLPDPMCVWGGRARA
jgi:SAM-dependent methyltransferase